VGELGESTKFTILVPGGRFQLRTTNGSIYGKHYDLNIIGGEEIQFYWSVVGYGLVEKRISDSFFNVSSLLSRQPLAELKNNFSSTIKIINSSINDYEANLEITTKEDIARMTINSEEVSLVDRRGFNYRSTLNFGLNIFNVKVINSNGLELSQTYKITRLTDSEKKTLADAENIRKRIASEAMEQEKIRVNLEEAARRAREDKIAIEGDGSNNDKICQGYGFKLQTVSYAECRMKLDFAKNESIKQQQQYERDLAEYQNKLAEIQKERDKQRALRQLELGLRMMAGQPPIEAIGSVGTNTPIAPQRPSSINQTITLPNGKMINCSTSGTITNCF
jgi:hypothetical protein